MSNQQKGVTFQRLNLTLELANTFIFKDHHQAMSIHVTRFCTKEEGFVFNYD